MDDISDFEKLDEFASDIAMFDTSDISIDFQHTKGLSKIVLVMKSDSPINLMRFYLKLKEYTFEMEKEIGIMADESFEEH